MRGLGHVARLFFGREPRPVDEPVVPHHEPRTPGAVRTPTEHGPTKAPFSRERRRIKARMAHRSFMRNQRKR